MPQPPAPDPWTVGDAYEQYVGRWSRPVAARFLAGLAMPAGLRWLDVGCGTGALCNAILDQVAPASVVGVEPSAGFLAAARQRLASRVEFHPGDAASIPLPDASVDVTASALVLNFVADVDAALREMLRVTRPGGTVAAYVWDYAGKMELMRHFWDAAVALDPQAASRDEGIRFPLCNPEALGAAFARVGLQHVVVHSIDIPTRFADFDDYWRPFLGGQGPAPGYAMALDTATRDRLRERIRNTLPRGRRLHRSDRPRLGCPIPRAAHPF